MDVVYRNEGRIMKNAQADLFSIIAPYDATYVLTCTASNYSSWWWFNFSSADDSVGSGWLPTADTPYNLKIRARADTVVKVNWYRTVMSDITVRPYVSNQWKKTVYQKSDDFLANEEYSFTSNVNGTLYFTFDTYLSRNDVSTYPNLYIYKNWTQVYYNYFEYSQNGKHEFEIESAVWDVFTMKATRYQPWWSMAVRAATSNMLVITTWSDIELRPSIIREIWTVWVATSYGKVNGVFKWGQFVGTTTSVTTGTIALWNAVGYLEVNYLWEIYKIPYYK